MSTESIAVAQQLISFSIIHHTKIKAKSPQTNGICERFNRTIQNEFYAIAFRKKIYSSVEQLQHDLDEWMLDYNTNRTHSGRHCYGKTPMQTFIDGKLVAKKYYLDGLKSAPLADSGISEEFESGAVISHLAGGVETCGFQRGEVETCHSQKNDINLLPQSDNLHQNIN